jgi:hypothetical protein
MSTTAHAGDSKGAAVPSIPIVVVESHQHVLEHVHAVLRHRARLHSRKIRQRQRGEVTPGHRASPSSLPPSVSMIHFDSHPDLACPSPSVPARACFEPRREWPVEKGTNTQDKGLETTRNLYEHLDLDRSGIAQWILPLVLSGDVDSVHWVRSVWADQMEDGQHRYNVGAWISRENGGELPSITKFVDLPEEAIMKVSFDHKYYLEDNSSVAFEELILPKELKLHVSELLATNDEYTDHDVEEQEWILDICLDYFVCRNPFLDEIEDIDAEFAAAYVAFIEQAKFCPSRYEHFQKSMAEMLRALICNDPIANDAEVLQGDYFYGSNGVGEGLLQRLKEAVFKCADGDRPRLIQLAIDALPSVTLPHDEYADKDEALKSATMQIEAMEAYLRDIRASSARYRPEPIMITVARSANDGFTPKDVVDLLQCLVLGMVHRVYCSCGRNDMLGDVSSSVQPTSFHDCRINSVFDYGECEGSELALR